MSLTIAAPTPAASSVGMGQIAVARKPARLTAVLGSCVGIALYHPRLQLGALAHVVLPDSNGRAPAQPGKFADTAVPHMLELLEREGVKPSGLVAKIAGGACMFGSPGPLQIGEANIQAVTAALERAGLRVAASDVGGTSGRRVQLDTANGSLHVEIAGQAPRAM